MQGIQDQQWKRLRSGFTLVELLISIAIVGLLVGLAVPAMQSIRETSRNTSCRNNLRQISLAILNYEASHRHFPPGTLGFDEAFEFDMDGNWLNPDSRYFWKRTQHTSALALVLPFLELRQLYESVDRNVFDLKHALDETTGGYTWFGEVDGFLQMATTDVSLFHCPTDNMEAARANPDLIVYGGTQPTSNLVTDYIRDGFAWIALTRGYLRDRTSLPGVYDEALELPFGLTNYAGCSGAHSGGRIADKERQPFTGIMSSRKPRRRGEITDGTGSTLLFGETIGRIREGKRWAAYSWCIGGLARTRGDLPWMLETHPHRWNLRHLGSQQNASAFGFGSKHPQIVNFAMGDGSVHSISREVNWLLLYQIGGMADGTVIKSLY